MCNKILICLYRKRLFNCGSWPTYMGDQRHGFYHPVLKRTDRGVLTHDYSTIVSGRHTRMANVMGFTALSLKGLKAAC